MSEEGVNELRDLAGGRKQPRGARPIRWGELADVIEIFTPAIESGLQRIGDLFAWLVEHKIVVPGQVVVLDNKLALAVMTHALPSLGSAPGVLRALQKFTAIVTDRELREVQALTADEGVRLAIECYEVNRDFFHQRLLPLLRDVLVRMNGRSTGPSPAAGVAAGTPPSSS